MASDAVAKNCSQLGQRRIIGMTARILSGDVLCQLFSGIPDGLDDASSHAASAWVMIDGRRLSIFLRNRVFLEHLFDGSVDLLHELLAIIAELFVCDSSPSN